MTNSTSSDAEISWSFSLYVSNCEVKFFIDANVHVRTKRRQHDLSEKGEASEYNQVLKQIVERDNQIKTLNEKLSLNDCQRNEMLSIRIKEINADLKKCVSESYAQIASN